MSVDDDSSGLDEPAPASSPEPQANNTDDNGDPSNASSQQQRSVAWFDGKVGGFTLLLLDEFLTLHGLAKTATLLKLELQENQIAFPCSELWFELYPSCHAAISQPTATATSSVVEKLVGFCLELPSQHRRRSLKTALDLQPVTVCASPKRLNSNELFALSVTKKAALMATPSALSLMEAHTQLMRSPIVRPSRRAMEQQSSAKSSDPAELRVEPSPSSSSANPRTKLSIKKKKRRHPGAAAAARRSSVQTNASAAPEQPPPGTYGEPALVQAHDALLKRDLSSSRFLERELRHIRLEKISESPKRLLQQTAMASATASMAESDSYLHALMLERYGFNKRQDCALCQVSFLFSNLPHRVSFKCVLDVYEQWQFTPPDLATSAKYKPPLCYDAVQVCRMCAQIIGQYSAQRHQRPTVAEQPLSSARRARSMGSLPSRGGGSRGEDKPAFCSDPFALPPLFGDDCYDCDDWSNAEDGVGGPDDSLRCAITTEFPAKAIVYAQQQSDTMPSMTAKEWSVINPERSLIRQTMEESLANAAAMAIMAQASQQH